MQKHKNAKKTKPKKSNKQTAKTIVSVNEVRKMGSALPNNKKVTVISKKEFLTNVLANTDGTARFEKYEMNPARKVSFPWLSQVAIAYERYRFKKFKILFEPSVSTIIPGIVALAPEFDIDEPLPTEKKVLFQYEYLKRDTPFRRFEYNVLETDVRTTSWMFCRSEDLALVKDPKLYDSLYMILYTEGITGLPFVGGVIGELWIDYEIEFKNPTIPTFQALDLSKFRSFSIQGGASDEPMGTSANITAGTLPVSYVIQAQNSFIFPLGFKGYCNVNATYVVANQQLINSLSIPILGWTQNLTGTWKVVGTQGVLSSDFEITIGRFVNTVNEPEGIPLSFSGSIRLDVPPGGLIYFGEVPVLQRNSAIQTMGVFNVIFLSIAV